MGPREFVYEKDPHYPGMLPANLARIGCSLLLTQGTGLEIRMAIYELWRKRDNKTFDAQADNEGHALSIFQKQLGATLSFKGTGAPQYLLRRGGEDSRIEVFDVH
jgi:hypothetical protein